MNRKSRVLFLCVAITFSLWNIFAEQESNEAEQCKVIVQALEAAKSLKPGMTRAEVEKDFRVDGGISFWPQDRYVYRKCPYIKIDVEFGGRDIEKTPYHLPKDEITSVSHPYLDYPYAD